MSVSFSKSSYLSNSKKVNVIANWSWNIVPIFKSTDLFVVAFQAVDPNLHYIDVTPTRMEGLIRYHKLNTGLHDHNIGYTGKADSILRSVSGTIPMVKNDNYYWAKSGTLSLQLEPRNSTTASINYVNVGAYFGHRTLRLTGSISYSISGGISVTFQPNITTVTSGHRTGRVTSSGSVTNN